MKEFKIYALTCCNFQVFDVILAHNLRDAWRMFKSRHVRYYGPLRFISASTSDRFYHKVN